MVEDSKSKLTDLKVETSKPSKDLYEFIGQISVISNDKQD